MVARIYYTQVPCPYCSHGLTRIMLTNRFVRRRECLKCHARFTTYEKPVTEWRKLKEAQRVAT